MDGREQLVLWRWRTHADISLLRFDEGECKEDKMVEEERSSLRSAVSAAQVCSAEESAETLKTLPDDVER